MDGSERKRKTLNALGSFTFTQAAHTSSLIAFVHVNSVEHKIYTTVVTHIAGKVG